MVLVTRSSPRGGTRDKPKNVCVGGYLGIDPAQNLKKNTVVQCTNTTNQAKHCDYEVYEHTPKDVLGLSNI